MNRWYLWKRNKVVPTDYHDYMKYRGLNAEISNRPGQKYLALSKGMKLLMDEPGEFVHVTEMLAGMFKDFREP